MDARKLESTELLRQLELATAKVNRLVDESVRHPELLDELLNEARPWVEYESALETEAVLRGLV